MQHIHTVTTRLTRTVHWTDLQTGKKEIQRRRVYLCSNLLVLVCSLTSRRRSCGKSCPQTRQSTASSAWRPTPGVMPCLVLWTTCPSRRRCTGRATCSLPNRIKRASSALSTFHLTPLPCCPAPLLCMSVCGLIAFVDSPKVLRARRP